MGVIGAMVVVGLLGLACFVVAALARPAVVPLAVVGLGGATLAALAAQWHGQPCTGDAAGCGMAGGFAVLVLLSGAVPLAGGALAAIGWRVVAGRNAGIGARLLVMGVVALAIALIAYKILA